MILRQLHDDLMVAAARESAPRRRPALLLSAAAAVTAAVVAVVLVRGTEPEREVAVPPPAIVTVPVADVRPPLSLRASVAGGDEVCLAFARDASVRDCVPRFSVLESFDSHAAPVTFHVRRVDGAYVVAGVADARVDHVAVVAPEGERAQARMGEPRLELTGGPRVRPYVAALRLERHPGELKLTVTHAGAMDDVRIPPPRIPGRTYSPQRRRISLLERPRRPKDAAAAAELRRAHKSRAVAATARVATRFQGRPLYAYVNRAGSVCLVNIGTTCTSKSEALGDRPLTLIAFNQDHDRVSVFGLIHDGPAGVTLERKDGSTRSVAVVENVFAFTDQDVVRVRWRGLEGPAKLELGENPVRP